MRPIAAIAWREVTAWLRRPAGWALLAGSGLVAALLFTVLVDAYLIRRAELVVEPWAAQHTNLVDHLVGPHAGNVAVLLLLLGPTLTAGSLTLPGPGQPTPLLALTPLPAPTVVAGKALGAATLAAIPVALCGALPWLLVGWAPLDVGAWAVAMLGLALTASVAVSVGLAASAHTEHPATALFVGVVALLALWVLGWLDQDPTALTSQLALSTHLRDLLVGTVRLSDLTYFVGVTAVALALAEAGVIRGRAP